MPRTFKQGFRPASDSLVAAIDEDHSHQVEFAAIAASILSKSEVLFQAITSEVSTTGGFSSENLRSSHGNFAKSVFGQIHNSAPWVRELVWAKDASEAINVFRGESDIPRLIEWTSLTIDTFFSSGKHSSSSTDHFNSCIGVKRVASASSMAKSKIRMGALPILARVMKPNSCKNNSLSSADFWVGSVIKILSQAKLRDASRREQRGPAPRDDFRDLIHDLKKAAFSESFDPAHEKVDFHSGSLSLSPEFVGNVMLLLPLACLQFSLVKFIKKGDLFISKGPSVNADSVNSAILEGIISTSCEQKAVRPLLDNIWMIPEFYESTRFANAIRFEAHAAEILQTDIFWNEASFGQYARNASASRSVEDACIFRAETLQDNSTKERRSIIPSVVRMWCPVLQH